MKKLLVAALVLAGLVGGGVLLTPTVKEMLADSNAAKMVGKCYRSKSIYFGLNSYDKETNSFKFEGALMGMIPVSGEALRDPLNKEIEAGNIKEDVCPQAAQQQMEEEVPDEEMGE